MAVVDLGGFSALAAPPRKCVREKTYDFQHMHFVFDKYFSLIPVIRTPVSIFISVSFFISFALTVEGIVSSIPYILVNILIQKKYNKF